MDFKLPENTTMIADTARRYLKDNYSFDTYVAQLDKSNHLDVGRWQTMTDLGWFGLPFAESVGGYGGSLLDVAAIVQEMGASLCLDPFVDLIVSPGKLLEYANTSASLSLLDQIIAGEARIACGLYDRHAGYRVLNPSLRLNGGRLSGQKHIVSDGGCADTVLLSAMSGDELVIVVLPFDACDVERYRLLDGSRAASLTLDDVEIDEDMILCRGDAAEQAVTAWFDYLCALDCARMYGACREVFQSTLEYARTRKQFGTAIGSFQVIQHYLVDIFIDLQQLESMLLMVSVKGESDCTSERSRATAAAKAYYASQAVLIAQQGIQIHGGVGVTEELNVGHYFRLITHCSLSHGDREHHITRFSQAGDNAHGGI
ncbi:acyl-CoA dehydrogenase family protein [Alcanivorax sp.]|jgi:alkylation response protein AidB-like acyl-CoA dehydrogenase|uniref:acyl-CoA dehydrogenase family protein n=1 Tax=Alcanivorax sp. TaxID=1872427 RepID=UPI0032D8DB86